MGFCLLPQILDRLAQSRHGAQDGLDLRVEDLHLCAHDLHVIRDALILLAHDLHGVE